MAKHIITQYIDDLDGSTEGVETVTFAYSGVNYEIDLASTNRSKLDSSLRPFLSAARSVRPGGSRTRAPKAQVTSSAPKAKEVRQWAADNGIAVPTRGRIPALVLDKYAAAVA